MDYLKRNIYTKENLSKLKHSFYSVFYNGPDSIFLIYRIEKNGLKGKIIEANPGAVKILKYPKEELLKKNILEIIHPDNIRDFNKTQVLKDRIIDSEIDYLCKDESVVHAEALNICIELDHDETIVVNLSRDISKRIQKEKDLLHSEQILKESNDSKDKFLSIIAHDLKNNFNNIQGFSELLTKNFDELKNEEIKKYIYHINEASALSHNLLENLLNWSRSETGSININPKLISIHNLISDSINLYQNNLEKKKILIETNTNPDLKAFADPNMFQTIIRNLLSNAIKFTPFEGKIKINVKAENKFIRISVIDNGIGITSENIKKLFKLKETFSTHGTNHETGTGLGLILCKDFIERNGGEISVSSKPDQGSTFSFTLPANKSSYHPVVKT